MVGGDSSSRRWSRIFKLDARAEVTDELAFHLEQRVRDNMAHGMDPETARAAAEQRIGDLQSVQRECVELLNAERRMEARRHRLRVSWLDFKLGLRMLVKYPGLTLIGGLAMAFAIWVGAGTFEVINRILHPALPLPDGDRIVALRNWDVASSRVEHRVLHDFAAWREEVQAVEHLGAYRTVHHNLAIEGRVLEPVEVAEISAAVFRMARVPPLLGRPLMEADEQADARAVVVIGYAVWQSRFEGAADVIGRTVKLGSVPSTVVGVMPEDFAFPVSHHVWVPLRLNALAYPRGEGPSIRVFGRLARGASFEDAQAELTALGARASADFPATHEYLRPQVIPYTKSILNLSGAEQWLLRSGNLFVIMLLVLISANVALLIFARAATRESEITVRNALGATRARIIGQLFVEALVLGAFAAALGLAATGYGLRWAVRTIVGELAEDGNMQLPFWFDSSLSPATIGYVALLTVLGAAIAGVLPALKVTRGLQLRLRASAQGGPSFGGVWTAVIVAQVALTVSFPFVAFLVRRDAVQIREQDTGIADREFLTTRLELDRSAPDGTIEIPTAELAPRFAATYQELERRLEADPAVASVTFGTVLPRMYHPHRLVDVDAGGAAPLHPQWPAYRVSSALVGVDFFDALGVPILAGRNFRASDIGSEPGVIIVNESFVKRVLGGRNPIGRHVQYKLFEDRYPRQASPDEPWYEIVGVVRDLGMSANEFDPKIAGFYHPATPGAAVAVQLAIRVKGDPATFTPRLRTIASSVDAGLRLHDPMTLTRVSQFDLQFYAFWFKLTVIVSAIALTLSLAGIYAVMAFTVSRRTREIGIRVALGCSPWSTVAAILRRPVLQVSVGIAAGAGLVALMTGGYTGGLPAPKQVALLMAYAAATMAVCMLACIVPARRALRVQPMDALRVDA